MNPLKKGQLREEGRYMWAQPTPPHIPVLAPRGWFLSALNKYFSKVDWIEIGFFVEMVDTFSTF